MRTVAITIYNTVKFEIFLKKRNRSVEIWLVGPHKGNRMILDHHLTHDDIEKHLEYAQPCDLFWRDAPPSEIPIKKHRNAIEMEETIKVRKFIDYDDPQIDVMESLARQAMGQPVLPGQSFRSVASHLSSIVFITPDKKEIRKAKQLILGRWTDGVVTLDLQPNHKLQWACANKQHPLNVGEQVHGCIPNWWNFAAWRIALFNDEKNCGMYGGILRVDNNELHFTGGYPHRIALVFRRVIAPNSIPDN